MLLLKVGYWNINGHTSKRVGEKLSDPEFLNLVKDIDILGMGELHAEQEVCVPIGVSAFFDWGAKSFGRPTNG